MNGGGSAPAPQASARVWADMVDSFQDAAMSTDLGIPMIFGRDFVHGHNNVYGATIFPHNIGLGATRYAATQDGEGAMRATVKTQMWSEA